MKKKTKSNKNIPTLVKVISILGLIGAAILILMGIVILFVFASFNSDPSLITSIQTEITANNPSTDFDFSVIPSLILVLGLFFVFISIISIVICIGLLKGKEWARLSLIVLLTLDFIYAIFNLIAYSNLYSIIDIILDGLIVGYFAFNKDVIRAFKKR